MAFVIDASVAAVWAFDDEDHPLATLAQQSLLTENAFAPSLWWFELRNTMIMNERRKRITEPEVEAFISLVTRAQIQLDFEPGSALVLALARRHKITVYDAAYLELALRKRCPLATLDRALAQAAQAEGIALLGT